MRNLDFATWLNQQLKQRNWSIRELGRRSAVSHSWISNVVNKGKTPDWNFCASIAPALGLSPIEIFLIAGKIKAEEDTRKLKLSFDEKEHELKILDQETLQMAKEINALPPQGRKVILNTIDFLLFEIRQLTQGSTINKQEFAIG